MASLFDKLTDLLKDQADSYSELVALARTKKDVIVANDAEGLQKITSDENAIVGKVQKQDKAREALMREIGQVVGLPGGDYTLTALCDTLENENIEAHIPLRALINQTRDVLDELKTLNDQNKQLVESSLDYIDFSVNIIRSSHEPQKRFYDFDGEEIADTGGFFDARQ